MRRLPAKNPLQVPQRQTVMIIRQFTIPNIQTGGPGSGTLVFLLLSIPSQLAPREIIREPVAEFFGTMVLVIFGNGAACQVTLSSDPAVASSPKGVSTLFTFGLALRLTNSIQDFLSSSLGWATGECGFPPAVVRFPSCALPTSLQVPRSGCGYRAGSPGGTSTLP